jgi:2-polyprenyl-3-methyl-5-hydroxy-6-metoxy-1,4-benzoquinol methylase
MQAIRENVFMKKVFKTEKANIIVRKLSNGRKRVTVEPFDKGLYVPCSTAETELSMDAIEILLKLLNPIWVPANLVRGKKMQNRLKWWILAYVSQDEFKDKRILDFGCGTGTSTRIFARMFPESDIIGIDISHKKISIGKLITKQFGLGNVNFLVSPDPDGLPGKTGYFDFINLTGVYEHLLPYERKTLLPKIWNVLKQNGILFINQTPNRCFPMVQHTTEYLPLVNYLPDKIAHIYVRNFGKKRAVFRNYTWETLLKQGVRGGSVKEIMRILGACSHKPILMNPSRLSAKDRVDLWYKIGGKKPVIMRKIYFMFLKSFYILTGIVFLPSLTLAIRKIYVNGDPVNP